MVINHNISALNTYNQLTANTTATTDSLEKLSSGLRINKAADDAAGLAISEKMKAQINGLDTASDNTQDGVSLVQTAEGALTETQTILQRMNELAVQAANGTNSSSDDAKIQSEITQLQATVDDISSQTTYNTEKVFSTAAATVGSLMNATGITLQVGADASDTMKLSLTGAMATAGASSVSSTGLGVGSSQISLATTTCANEAITSITSAIQTISSLRATLGAYQNSLTYTDNNLTTESENLTSAESQITDVDMAEEMTNYTKNNILVQSAEAMLSQANSLPQGILSLLK